MIIISSKPGQLGNLLFTYSNFLAFGIENGITIINPSFHSYRMYFKGTSGFTLVSNKLFYSLAYYSARILYRLNIKNRLVNVVHLENSQSMDLENDTAIKSKICFVQGWLFRSDRLILKHKRRIIDFFSPTSVYQTRTDAFFSENFPGDKLVIGVHIRRGDYKTFENGRYYYAIDKYLEIMDKVSLLFPDQNIHFLVCSNEMPEFGLFSDKNFKIVFAPQHELMDMCCMMKCNYILGPPSTYSMWASFYTGVPLYSIQDPNKTIELNDFKPFLT